MAFLQNFTEDEKRTVRAELSNLLHHYDEVEPVIRVGDWNRKYDGFRLGMTAPTPSDDDLDTVAAYLDEHGYETRRENGMLFVVGEHEAMEETQA